MTERRLAAIAAADVVGYSRQIGLDEAGALSRLSATRSQVTDPLIAEHQGRIFKTMGDGFLAEFSSTVQALRCVIAIQARLAERNAASTEEERLLLRIGLHQGDVVVQDGDLLGDGVNVAARLEALASPGGICISGRVREDAAGRIQCDVEDIGEQVLKNIAAPIRVYRVRVAGSSPPGPAMTPPDKPALALPDKPSLAVLPFINMSGDPEQEYFADGMAEDIITALSRVPWLFVIARNSSFSYKGKNLDLRQIARELGVRYVLEGSVRKAGNRVRITGQLIESNSGVHIWADRIDGGIEDVFELQDKVTERVVASIEPRLRAVEMERARRKPTENLEAYDLFLRALANLHRTTRQPIEEALRLVDQVIALDPDYAMAIGLKARLIYRSKVIGFLAPSDPLLDEAVRLAWRAAEKGREDPDVLWLAGFVVALAGGDFAGGVALIGRSLAINPNSAEAITAQGLLHAYLGQADVAITNLDKAMRLDPVPSASYITLLGYATLHFVLGQYDIALAWANKSLYVNPNWRVALQLRAACLGLLGQIDDARLAVGQVLAQNPNETIASMREYLKTSYQRRDSLEAYLEGLRRAGLPEQ
jgi:TolB-like protein/class 3 adenylate cyclase